MIPKAPTGMSVRKRYFQDDIENMLLLGRGCGGLLQLEISKYLLLCSKHMFMLIPGVPLYFMSPGTLVRTVLTQESDTKVFFSDMLCCRTSLCVHLTTYSTLEPNPIL